MDWMTGMATMVVLWWVMVLTGLWVMGKKEERQQAKHQAAEDHTIGNEKQNAVE